MANTFISIENLRTFWEEVNKKKANQTDLDKIEAQIPTLPDGIMLESEYVTGTGVVKAATNASNLMVGNSAVSGSNFVQKDGNKQLSTNDYTTAEKQKLGGIADGATKVIVDSALSATSTNAIQNKAVNTALDGKVDKVSGKDLSTNDYTTAEKTKLAGVAEGANKTIINNTLTSTSTAEALSAAQGNTLNTSVTNVSNRVTTIEKAGYITNAVNNLNNYYLKTEIDTKITEVVGQIHNIKLATYTSLSEIPAAEKNENTIYLVPKDGSDETQNIYDEYIWISSKNSFEKIGDTKIDLTDYYNTSNFTPATDAEIKGIFS